MTELIRGKVARILNSRELALNVGSDQGVRHGMEFDILSPELHDIEDPDSGEVIGSVNRPKVRVRVGIVDDRFCVARTFRRKRVNIGGRGFTLRIDESLFEPPNWVTRSETLKTEEATWEDLSEEDSYVKTGDPAVQVRSAMTAAEDEPSLTHEGTTAARKATA